MKGVGEAILGSFLGLEDFVIAEADELVVILGLDGADSCCC